MGETNRKLFVLDTNILLHEPFAIFSFQEHDVVIPMTVLEELDRIKDSKRDVARDARIAIRALEDLFRDATPDQISEGIPFSKDLSSASGSISILADYELQDPEYVVLNGTTGVTVTGNYMRCSRASIILSGSSDGNEGTITVRQATTTTNVFAIMPVGFNQTAIAADTIPAGKIGLVEDVQTAITRASGADGSATASFRVRRHGEVFRAVPPVETQTGAVRMINGLGLGTLPAGTDYKMRIDTISDNNTIIDAEIKVMLINT